MHVADKSLCHTLRTYKSGLHGEQPVSSDHNILFGKQAKQASYNVESSTSIQRTKHLAIPVSDWPCTCPAAVTDTQIATVRTCVEHR